MPTCAASYDRLWRMATSLNAASPLIELVTSILVVAQTRCEWPRLGSLTRSSFSPGRLSLFRGHCYGCLPG